jgi:apolipoprotein N-acyltransferase
LKEPEIKNYFGIAFAFAVTAVLLSIIQPPVGLSFLAWIAYVPFILACSPRVKFKTLIISSYIVSLCYWLVNLYWIYPVTIVGWLVFCAYTALLWPLLAAAIRFGRAKRLPLFLTAAILIVGAERLQGFILGGFLWRHLSHSQYENIILIQIADIFGAAGLSGLIAMVNALCADLLIAAFYKKLFTIRALSKILLVTAALVATFFYGRWRIEQYDKIIEDGPLVAALQSNIPQSVKSSDSDEINEQTFTELLQESNKIANAEPLLIVWPETVVPALLDERILRVIDPSSTHKQFDLRLREHAKDNAYLLVGASGGKPKFIGDLTIQGLTARYNSAFLYTPHGSKAYQQYNKIHLVPFGEFVPFKKKLPWLYNLLMKFTPYDFDYSQDAGDEYTIFEIDKPNRSDEVYRFSVMICYEDTVPDIARRFTLDEQGRKQIDWLINISNDGWFVKFKNDKAYPSTELAQHAAVCVFRAVENRIAVLRSVNTGISCLIDSAGRIKNGFADGNLPLEAMNRTAIIGWFADKMPIDKRVTFYSKYGSWLDTCCAIFFAVLMSAAIIKRKSR